MRKERLKVKRGGGCGVAVGGKLLPAFSARPPSVAVGGNGAPAVSARAPSMAVGGKPLHAFSARTPSMAIALEVLGRRLRVLRFVRGWSQETLAELSGLHRTYVSAIERGRCNLRLESMTRLADALGVGVVELLDGRGAVEIGEFPPPPARGEGF